MTYTQTMLTIINKAHSIYYTTAVTTVIVENRDQNFVRIHNLVQLETIAVTHKIHNTQRIIKLVSRCSVSEQ